MDVNRLVERNLKNPPTRDVVMPPGNGYAVVRLIFDNPGFVTAHCHIESHALGGMLMVFMVGNEEEIRHYSNSNHIFDPSPNNRCIK